MKITKLKTFCKAVVALPSIASGAGNVNGTAVDLVAQPEVMSGMVLINVGSPTGTPDSFSAVYKLQTSSDNFSADTTDVDSVTVTGAGVYCISFDPGALSQYVRVRRELTITNGSSPTVPNGALFVLGDPKYGPLAGT